jgi:NADH dehydrogenase/NADH:ubiquinone oxidoreductase subunit G
VSHPEIVYESGKCISCGLCIQVARKHGEKLGVCFAERGFMMRMRPPFDEPMAKAWDEAADEAVRVCPTGALAFQKDQKNRRE